MKAIDNNVAYGQKMFLHGRLLYAGHIADNHVLFIILTLVILSTVLLL
jgi:hypothetical protein